MNTGTLVLSFSEPVEPSSVNFSKARLESSAFRDVSASLAQVPLQAGSYSQERSLNLTLQVAEEALNAIKLTNNQLCSSRATCYLRISEGFVTDTSGNPIAATSGSDNERFERRLNDSPEQLVLDSIGPALLNASLNMDLGTVELIFDEPVDVDTVDARQLEIRSTAVLDATGAQIVPLGLQSDQESFGKQSTGARLTLAPESVLRLKSATTAAKSKESSFVRARAGLIADLAAESNVNADMTVAQLVTSYVPDSTAPELAGFVQADLNLGVLRLAFNEPVAVATFNGSLLELSSSGSKAAASSVYALRHPVSVTYADATTGLVLELMLDSVDREAINLDTDLAVSRETTHVLLGAKAVSDVSGVGLAAMSAATQVVTFVALERSALQGFSLDMTLGKLALTFSQTMNVNTLQASEVQLQSASRNADAQASLALSMATTVVGGNGFRVVLNLTNDDLDVIKSRPELGTSSNNTFLALSSDAMEDVRGQPVLAVLRSGALSATQVEPDTIAPKLVSYNFSLDAGELALSFSEVVLPSRANVSRAGFVHPSDASVVYGLVVDSIDGVPFVAGRSASRTVVLSLSKVLMDALKADREVAVNRSTTVLRLAAGFVTDTSSKPSLTSDDVVAAHFEADVSRPELIGAAINLTSGTVLLSFSETVVADQSQATRVVLENTTVLVNGPIAAGGVQLSGGSISQVADVVLRVVLVKEDLDRVKASANLGLSASNTFVRLLTNMTRDSSALPSIASDSFAVVPAADEDLPFLLNASLDMDARNLVLSFSEPVDSSAMQVTAISLFSLPAADSHRPAIPLDAGSIVVETTSLSRVLVIALNAAVFDELALRTDLATEDAATGIAMAAGAVQDTSGNALMAIPQVADVVVALTASDQSAPSLVGFTVDLSQGLVIFRFDEPVNASSFNPSALVARSSQASDATSYSLTSGSLQTVTNGRRLVLALSEDDLNQLKAQADLWHSNSTTFVSLASTLVMDMAGNQIEAVLPAQARRAVLLVVDDGSPELTAFDFDLGRGLLTLNFSESMNASSIVVEALVFQASDDSVASDQVRLRGGTVTAVSPLQVTVALTTEDLHALKRARVAVEANRTFLTFGSDLARDMAGVPVVPAEDGLSTMTVSAFSPDKTPVAITNVSLSLDTAVLELTFAEPVLDGSVEPRAITLLNVSNASKATRVETRFGDVGGANVSLDFTVREYVNFTLTGGIVVVADDGLSASIAMLPDDLDFLKLQASDMVFLVAQTNVAQDLQGNAAVRVSANQALAPSVFTLDATAPVLSSFGLNLNATPAIITLTFDEPVRVASVNLSRWRLLVEQDGQGVSLGSGSVQSASDGRVIAVNLPLSWKHAVQRVAGLGAAESSSLLRGSAAAVEDVRGNVLQAMASAQAPTTMVQDAVAPMLTRVSLDMELGLLQLTFDEVVLPGAEVRVTGVVLSDSSNSSRVRLSDASVASSPARGLVQNIQLGLEDMNEIKSSRRFISNPLLVSIDVGPGTVQDVFYNFNLFASMTAALVLPDRTRPSVVTAIFDVNIAQIQFHHSEPIAKRIFNHIQLGNEEQSMVITDAIVTPVANAFVTVLNISKASLDLWKRRFRSDSLLFVTLPAGSYTDSFNNSNDFQSKIPLSISADTEPPKIIETHLNMNTESLSLSFNEPVTKLKLDLVQLQLGIASITLKNFSSMLLNNATFLQISFEPALADRIRSLRPLGHTSQTLVVVRQGAVQDHGNNTVLESILPPVFTPDQTPPTAVAFTLNADSMVLSLSFSEMIDVETVVRQLISLRNEDGTQKMSLSP
eukprot:TRINITY_DN12305_c0_g5_i1.p1 TRINITY_DN12305_c0_g5~~TRINITY_DN12305_c0_g5_i1.p1  ORF type:complete len:1793 (+),score=418.27 TRINITY_DN12305_c0_g5_i1:133-5511(+)